MAYEIHRIRIDKGTQKWASGSIYGAYSLAGVGRLKEERGQDVLDDSDPAIASSSSSFLLYTGYGFREIGSAIPLREPLQTDCVSKYGLIPSGNTEIILSGSDSNGWMNWYTVGSIRKVKEIAGTDCVSRYDLIQSGSAEIILSGSDSNGWMNWYTVGSIRKVKEIVGTDAIDLLYDVSIQSESLFTLSSSMQWPTDGKVKLYLAV